MCQLGICALICIVDGDVTDYSIVKSQFQDLQIHS